MSADYFNEGLKAYQSGLPWIEQMQRHHQRHLTEMKGSGIDQIEILASDDSCPDCRSMNGKVVALTWAMENTTLPNEHCSFKLKNGKPGWCRCTYLAVVDKL